MDKDIKKVNPAIEKVESLSVNNSVGGSLNGSPLNVTTGTVNPIPLVNELGANLEEEKQRHANVNTDLNLQSKRDKTNKDRKSRAIAEKKALMNEKLNKKAEKIKLKKAKIENSAKLKHEKAEEKAKLKKLKIQNRHERKKDNSDRKERRGDNRRNRGVGGWLAAVISLGCSVLILGSLLTMSVLTDYLNINKVNTDGATSQRSFYDFVGYIDNIETNMSKLFVATDGDGQQKVLSDLAVTSSLADAALSELPIMDESKYLTSKYINQVYDYAKYLNNRLIDGQALTNEEMQNLRELYNINLNLKEVLSSLSVEVSENYDFSKLSKNEHNDKIISQFNDIESSMMDYPEMIYDGPFSDGIQGKTAKGLIGEEINEIQAQEIFNKLFSDYGVNQVEVEGMVENGSILCYNLKADTDKNGEVYAQISKKGGKLIMFNAYRDCSGQDFSEEQCVEIAEQFLNKLEIGGMTCVWSYSSGSTEYLNFAYENNGVIFYPDLIKVKVCRERGVVSGIDADGYYMNHCERKLNKPNYTISEAEQKVSKELEVRSFDVAVIPTGGGHEKLAYEFIGDCNGETYYIYIDANTLKQADIFKVVNTEQGRLLV